MKKIFKKSSILFALVATSLLFFSCARTPDDSKKNGSDTTNTDTKKDDTNNDPADNTNGDKTDDPVTITVGTLTITTLKAYEKTVTKDETAKTITFEPAEEKVEYTLSGSFEGQIINKKKNTVFILSGVSLSNTDAIPAIFGEEKIEIKAEKETENIITISGTPADSKAKFGAILCDKAIEIGGPGKLNVTCECEKGHGIKASKIELKGSGTYTFDGGSDASAVNCTKFIVEEEKTFTANFKDSKNGIKADETITIASGSFIFKNITDPKNKGAALKTDTTADDIKDKKEPKDHFIHLDGGTFSFIDCGTKYSTEPGEEYFTKSADVVGSFE